MARDRELERRLRERGIAAESCPGNLLFEPGTILNASGKPYQVFTAFWRACLAMPGPAEPTPAPGRLRAPAQWPASLEISKLGLEPKADWAGGMQPVPFEAPQQASSHVAGRSGQQRHMCLIGHYAAVH